MSKIKFPSELNEKTALVDDDVFMVYDSEELDITKQVKFVKKENFASFNPDSIIFADSDGYLVSEGADGKYKPYKSLLELIDSYTYKTVLGYVTSGSPNVTGVPDVDIAKVKIGDKVKFSGMTTYGHTVVSITLSAGNNTIVTNTNFAVSSGVELSVYTEKMVKAFGTFNIDASIEKDGLFWDFSGATCIIGNATAFSITSAKNSDFVVKGGKWLGVHANSKLYNNTATQNVNHYLYFVPNKYDSIATGYVLESSSLYCGNVRIDSDNGIYARNGKICDLRNYSAIIQGYKYGLLEGITLRGEGNVAIYGLIDGITETPAAINAVINGTNSYRLTINGVVKGSILGDAYTHTTINATVIGTNINLPGADFCEINNDTIITTGTISTRGHFIHKGIATGTWTLSGDGVKIMENLAGSVSISGGTNNRVRMCKTYAYYNGSITLTNSAQLVLEQSQEISEYYYTSLSIASGCKLINKGYFRGKFSTDMAGTLINEGDFYHVDAGNNGITGTFIQEATGKFYFRASGNRYSDINYCSRLYLKNGSKCNIQGFLDASLLSTFAAIKKDANSTLVFENCKIKMYSGKSLIQCTSDVAGSKDIYVFGHCKTDADGTTYGILLPFDGSSYAPNAVILEQLTESTSLTNIL